MKILLIANSASGLLSFRKEVVKSFINRGDEVTINIPEDPRINDLKELGCEVVPVKNLTRHGMNPIKDVKLLREYVKLIKKIKPDVVLTYTIKPNVYGGIAASMAHIPYIVNITGLGTAVEYPGILQTITVTLYKLAMKSASCIFFQNAANEMFFRKNNICNDVHQIIPGSGVNLDYFTQQQYPPNDNPLKFLFISRLMKQKGIEEYFECAKYFKGKSTPVEFHILGSCEEDYMGLLSELEKSGIVIYHGRQNDVRPFITQSHCLIHPTYYPEGMSNVILEASASGRPVITTRRPGCQEAVDDGETGYLFDEKDTQGLIDCVEKFIALPHDQKVEMGLTARIKMEHQFDRQIVVNAYIKEISKVSENS